MSVRVVTRFSGWSAPAALAAGAALFLTGCAGQGSGGPAASGPIPAYASTRSQSSDPKAMRPVSVEHQGTLTPATGIADAIAGNTLIIVQPWVSLNAQELRESPIHFRSDGVADSPDWINARWSIDRSENLCIQRQGTEYCFVAFADDTGQAYLMRQSDQLLSKVSSIEAGDSRNVVAKYEEKVRIRQAQAERMGAMFDYGLNVLSAMGSGGGGGGSTTEDYQCSMVAPMGDPNAGRCALR